VEAGYRCRLRPRAVRDLRLAVGTRRWRYEDPKSRRTLELPGLAADALREHRARPAKEYLAAGQLWQDHGLVFASLTGTPLDASHVRRAFRSITRRAGLGENWTPPELRHSFASIMSDNGVPIENIAASVLLPPALPALAHLVGGGPVMGAWVGGAGGCCHQDGPADEGEHGDRLDGQRLGDE
jgi:integrase